MGDTRCEEAHVHTSSMIVAPTVLPLYVMEMGRKQLGPGYPPPYICADIVNSLLKLRLTGITYTAVQGDDLGELQMINIRQSE